MRLLLGVLFAVPYNMSSWVCLVFFICYCRQKESSHTKGHLLRWELSFSIKRMVYPFQFLLLLLGMVIFPLLLHILKKFLSVDQELSAVLLLPGINLGLQTLFQLEQTCMSNLSFFLQKNNVESQQPWKRSFF